MATVIGCDISRWQDNNSTARKVDFVQMRAAGAVFVICKASQANWRDEDFPDYWQAAKAAGLIRGAYHFLVWDMSGTAQAQQYWNLLKNDPGELPPVVDMETNPGVITPDSAVNVLRDFVSEIEKLSGRVCMIYTSKGFWKPFWATIGYNFARHPLWVAHYTAAATPLIPAPWNDYAIWQYTSSGDGKAYGVESLEIDLNRTTSEKLAALTGTIVIPKPEEPNMYLDLPLGYITSNTTDTGWNNTGFAFFIGVAGNSDSDPNPNLKPIEEKAAGLGKPFLSLWDFHPQYYVEQQYGPDDAHWPPLAQDKPYNACINAIRNRDPKALIVRVVGNINALDGKPIAPSWMDYSARIFCGRVSDWLRANKPGCKLILATNYPFIAANAPGISNWADKYAQMVTDNAPALESGTAYPVATQKPGYLGVNRWDLWQYRNNLILSWRDQASLYSWLGFTGTTPPPPPDPDPDPEPTADYAAVITALAKLSDKLDTISALLEVVEGGVCQIDENQRKIYRLED